MSNWTMAQQRLYRRQVKQLNGATGGNYGDDDRRALMARVTGKASTADLDREGMARVIDEQDRLLRQWHVCDDRPKRQTFRRRTLTQAEYIDSLVAQLGWDAARLNGFIARQYRDWRNSLAQLDRRQRSQLITALRGLLQSQSDGTALVDRMASPGVPAQTGGLQ